MGPLILNYGVKYRDKLLDFVLVLLIVESLIAFSKEFIFFGVFAVLIGYLVSICRHREKSIRELALHDHLTGLPNRILLEEKTGMALEWAKRHHSKFAVIFMDLNNFKKVNDRFGHEAGDMLLQEVAVRIRSCVRDEDMVAREGGDEFVILLNEVNRKEDPVKVAKKIMDCLREPVYFGKHKIIIGCSMGISMYPNNGREIKTLLRKADRALYVVKKSRGGGVLAFDKAMDLD